MEKLAENDLTYFYLRHVVIVVIAVTTISLPPVVYCGFNVIVRYCDRLAVVVIVNRTVFGFTCAVNAYHP